MFDHLNDLGAGVAGETYDRVSATSSQSHGKWGRAHVGPTKARQYDHHNKHLANQLRAALEWWLAALRNQVPRPVLLERVRRATPVLTCSDGEGPPAGVGVVTFGGFPDHNQPKPVYIEVPSGLRRLWDLQNERSITGVRTDISET